jgi:hypothetical protein
MLIVVLWIPLKPMTLKRASGWMNGLPRRENGASLLKESGIRRALRSVC